MDKDWFSLTPFNQRVMTGIPDNEDLSWPTPMAARQARPGMRQSNVGDDSKDDREPHRYREPQECAVDDKASLLPRPGTTLKARPTSMPLHQRSIAQSSKSS
ncbi:hypothetical protein RFN28_14210 [Mesorhizobium sp. VK24D]|uniref:Uncharacterized protein n=1 Tax=Mesorhizobium album TaxID=3072314 RepID=A0ABU4XY48_9HYPH|nr:hypothetical protein [Mesorhizobium sp. VK24D]MDX8479626.1 hypothetical protein [Mesorhizobium sp. VK24D]